MVKLAAMRIQRWFVALHWQRICV